MTCITYVTPQLEFHELPHTQALPGGAGWVAAAESGGSSFSGSGGALDVKGARR